MNSAVARPSLRGHSLSLSLSLRCQCEGSETRDRENVLLDQFSPSTAENGCIEQRTACQDLDPLIPLPPLRAFKKLGKEHIWHLRSVVAAAEDRMKWGWIMLRCVRKRMWQFGKRGIFYQHVHVVVCDMGKIMRIAL